MNLTARLRDSLTVTVDRHAVGLVAVFMAVLVPSVALTVYAPYDVTPNTYGMEGATLGGAWVVAEVAVAAVMLGLVALYYRLPEWVRGWFVRVAIAFMAMILGILAYVSELFWEAVAALVVVTFVGEAIEEYDLWWVANDVLALAIAIAVAPAGAIVFGVEALIVGLIGLAIYDWYFADIKTWMLDLATALIRARLPVLFIIPSKLQVDWEGLVEAWTEDDLPDGIEEAEPTPEPAERADELGISMGIGMADLLLPAMFASAVAIAPSPFTVGPVPAAVIGVAAGVALACFRLRWKVLEHDGGAGLPPLTTGALAGYAPFALAGWLVTVL